MQTQAPYFTTRWDLFAERTQTRLGWVSQLSPKGCVLRANDPIDPQRWLRMVIDFDEVDLSVVAVGWIKDAKKNLGAEASPEVSLYRYEIEFNYDLDLILALSRRNLMVFSCRARNTKSSNARGVLE